MPPTIAELVNEWTERFELLGIKKHILMNALFTRPRYCKLEALYRVCQVYSSRYQFDRNMTSSELVMLSGELSWVKQQLRSENQLLTSVQMNMAMYAAVNGNFRCLSLVLNTFQDLKNDADLLVLITKQAAIFGNKNCVYNLLGKYGIVLDVEILVCAGQSGDADFLLTLLKPSDKEASLRLAHDAAVFGRTECLLAIIKKYPNVLADFAEPNQINLAHLTAKFGNTECLLALLNEYPIFINSIAMAEESRKLGYNIADFASWSGDLECQLAVLNEWPHLISNSIECQLLIQRTIESGNMALILTAVKKHPDLKYNAHIQSALNIAGKEKAMSLASLEVAVIAKSENLTATNSTELEVSSPQIALNQRLNDLQTASDPMARLDNLERRYHDLYSVCYNKLETIKAKKHFLNDPNLQTHYQRLCIRLEEIFLGCKVVASGVVAPQATGALTHTSGILALSKEIITGVDVVEKLALLVPFVGGVLGLILSIGTEVIRKMDQARLVGILTKISRSNTEYVLKSASEITARILTCKYELQLKQVSNSNDGQAKKIKSIMSQCNSLLFREGETTCVEEIADFAATQILAELLEGNIQLEQDANALAGQLVNAAVSGPSKSGIIKHAIFSAFGTNEIKHQAQMPWKLHEFYYKPGIVTENNDYYCSDDCNVTLYGYRLGSKEEAEALEMKKSNGNFTEVKNNVVTLSRHLSQTITPTSSSISTDELYTMLVKQNDESQKLRQEVAKQREEIERLHDEQTRISLELFNARKRLNNQSQDKSSMIVRTETNSRQATNAHTFFSSEIKSQLQFALENISALIK